MYQIPFGKSGIQVPTVAVGCMRIPRLNESQAKTFVETALEHGANFFDNADIYGAGESEIVLGKAIKGYDREKLLLQTKCGIVPRTMYDFSYEHIVEAVEGSLKRLGTDYIDSLVLHRPDALMEPEEVARAFDHLRSSGKVRFFGVSNHNSHQIALLSRYLDMPLCANQLQLSIIHAPMIQAGINVNMYNDPAVNRDGGVLDYCRLNDITIQPWSPMQYAFTKGTFMDNPDFPELNERLAEIAGRYSVSKTTIAIAWLLRHPAKMQPITGTMTISRLVDSLKATEVKLTRQEWYEIYLSAGNTLP